MFGKKGYKPRALVLIVLKGKKQLNLIILVQTNHFNRRGVLVSGGSTGHNHDPLLGLSLRIDPGQNSAGMTTSGFFQGRSTCPKTE
jgi:hypothetical protein